MSEELLQFVDSHIRIAQLRGVDEENPIVVGKSVDAKVFKISISLVEPTFNMLPYNLLWINADPESIDYRKIFRRVSHFPPADNSTRAAWVELTDMAELYAEEQYYVPVADTSFLNTDIPIIHIPGPASIDAHGTVKTLENNAEPRAVLTSSESLSDARVPLAHEHDDFARTMIQISTVTLQDGDGEDYVQPIYVQIDDSNAPSAGQVLVVAEQLSDYVYAGVWKTLSAEDIEGGLGPVVTGIVISGAPTVTENSTSQYTALLTMDDGTQVAPTSVEFEIEDNAYNVTLDSATGLMTVPELTDNVTVDVTAHYPDIAASQFSDTMTVSLVDNESGVYPTLLTILGSDEVQETESDTYVVQIDFSDGSQSSVTPDSFTSSNTLAAVIDIAGNLTTYAVTEDQTTTLEASYTYNGQTVTGTKDVIVKNQVRAVSIQINGVSSVVETGTAVFTVSADFDDSSSSDITPTSFTISAGASYGTLNGLEFTPNDVDGDQIVTLRATYDDGMSVLEATTDLTIIDTTVVLELLGADSINENESEAYTVNADGVPVSIDTLTAITGGMYVGISSNTVTALEVTGDKTATIEASVTIDGKSLSVSKSISIIDTTVYPTKLIISGDTEINENELSSPYSFDAVDADNNVIEADIDPDSVALSNNTVAVFSLPTKVMTARSFVGEQTVTMTATYRNSIGQDITGTFDVTLHDTVIHPQSISIELPDTADENTTFTPIVTLTNDDTSTRVLDPSEYTLTTNAVTYIVIDAATGEITVNPLDADKNILITATYEADGDTFTANGWVNLINTNDAVVDFSITGPSVVYAGQTDITPEYKVVVTRESGGSDPAVIAESYGITGTSDVSIDASGVLTFNVSEDQVLTDQPFTVEASMTIDGSLVTKSYNVTLSPMADGSLVFASVGDSTLDEEALSNIFTVTASYGSEWTEVLDVTNIQISGNDYGVTVVAPNQIQAPNNANNEPSVGLTLYYVWKGTTRTITHNVQLVNTDPTVLEARFTGIPATVTEFDEINPTNIEYRLSDAPTVWVAGVISDASLSSGSNLVTAAGSGESLRYTVNEGANGNLTVTGTVTYDGTVYDVTDYAFVAVTESQSTMPDTPMVGAGPFIDQSAWTEALFNQYLVTAHTDQSGQTFDLDVGWEADSFGWFAHKKSLSTLATLTDTASGFPGGWDGASWTESDFGGTGPIEATLGGEVWLIYRMDWPGQGPVSFRVDYA